MSLNQAMLIGNLGKDPELKTINNGTSFCNLSVATNEIWIGKDGNKDQKTTWHTITLWNKLAENCCKYLTSGSKVYLEGKIQTDKYQKDGEDKYFTKIIAHKVIFLDAKEKNVSEPHENKLKAEVTNQNDVNVSNDYADDDIPF